MPVPRLDEAGRGAVAAALADADVRDRFTAQLVQVRGSDCVWWKGAISGRGHGRFWIGPGRVVIAHRFAWAMAHGAGAWERAPLLGHRCDNPLCQRVGGEHLVASSALLNRREWALRRSLPQSPLADPRGPRRRARELRDLLRIDPELVALDLEALRDRLGEQLALW